MIAVVILMSLILIMLGFSIYIMGIISVKLDVITAFAKLSAEREQNVGEEDKVRKQFMNMMNYSAEEKGDEDE